MSEEKIIDKIHKLLAKAERTDNADEAEAFSAKAAELMERHTIDQSVLHRSKADPSGVVEFMIDVSGAYYIGLRDFAVHIGDALGFKVLIHQAGGKNKQVAWYGFADDLAVGEILWASLRLQCERFSRQHMAEYIPPNPLDDRSDRFYEKRSFMVGFGQRSAARLRASRVRVQKEAEETHGSSVALALVDRGSAIEEWIRNRYRVGTARSSRNRHSASGLHGGRAAADRADIGQNRVGGSRGSLRG